eukprot:scaffold173421_cov29-Tisochrysis_lutea.AAC.2
MADAPGKASTCAECTRKSRLPSRSRGGICAKALCARRRIGCSQGAGGDPPPGSRLRQTARATSRRAALSGWAA